MAANEPGEPMGLVGCYVTFTTIYLQTSFEVRSAKNSDICFLLYIREQNECMALKRK